MVWKLFGWRKLHSPHSPDLPSSSHYSDAIMRAMGSQVTGLANVCSTVYSGADQRKHQSSASLAFFRWNHRWPLSSPHKGPITRKIFRFDVVIMSENLVTPPLCQVAHATRWNCRVFWRFWAGCFIAAGYKTYCLKIGIKALTDLSPAFDIFSQANAPVTGTPLPSHPLLLNYIFSDTIFNCFVSLF